MTTHQTVRGKAPPEDLQALARQLVADVGDREAAKRLKLTRATLARVLAGLPILEGTLALLKQGLFPSEGAGA